jgi:hypothetical protein
MVNQRKAMPKPRPPHDAGRAFGETVRHSASRGIVSKRLGSPYRSGRSKDWLKFKNPAAPAVKRGGRGGVGQVKKRRGWEPHKVMTTAQCIKAAKAKTELVVDHLLYLLALHESNAIIVYSDTLSSQIKRSLAAKAFDVFRGGLHQFEIVRLCALWDGPDPDKENIPTIIKLIDHPDVIEGLAQETLGHRSGIGGHVTDPTEDPELAAAADAALRRSNEKLGRQEAQRARNELRKTIKDVRAILKSPMLRSIMNLRHKHLAHSLTQTKLEKAGPVAPMRYGDERKVLVQTLPIVETLHLWVNGKGFSFENSRGIARKNAEALWKGCTFDH